MKQVISGIQGLDEILGGGFIRPSTVLIAGVAGTGKTTFTMQSIFNSAREDEICLYITAISEPIAMINNFMSKFSFYNISLMGKGNIKYVTFDHALIKKGTSAIIEEIEKNIETIKPDRIVIDPANVLTNWLEGFEKRNLYYDLFSKMKSWNSLVLITDELSEEQINNSDISYVVDGIIYLSNEKMKNKRARYLEVLKMRGQDYQSGKHSIKITNNGIVTYPILRSVMEPKISGERINTGISGLDKMTQGGLIRGSSTMISGGSGTGKTMMGLQFITAGALAGEPGVFVTFEESPHVLRNNAASFGWNLEKLENEGILSILYTSSHKMDVNENALDIKYQVDKIKAKRVVIDGINGFYSILEDTVKLNEHVRVLSKYLSSKNITTIFTNEISELMGPLTISRYGTSLIMDTVILLRYVEIKSEMKKAISVLKMRGSNHDKEIREFEITEKGIVVKLPFSDYSGLMSGNPVRSPSEAFLEAFKR